MKNRKFSQDILKVWCGFKDNMTITTSFKTYTGRQDSIKWYGAYNNEHWKGSNLRDKGIRIECICEAVKRLVIDNIERTTLYTHLPDYKSSIKTLNCIKVAFASYENVFEIFDANNVRISRITPVAMKNIFVKGSTEFVKALEDFNKLTSQKQTLNNNLQFVDKELKELCNKYPMLKSENA